MLYCIFTIICCLITYLITKYFIQQSIDLNVKNSERIYKHLNTIVDDLNKIKKDIYQ